MAKAKLSKSAIAYIVRLRNDPDTTYGYQEIADLVKSNYEVEVSLQAVSLAYKKFKDSADIKEINNRLLVTESSIDNISEPVKQTIDSINSSKTLENKVEQQKNVGLAKKTKPKKGFNEDLGKDLSKAKVNDLLN